MCRPYIYPDPIFSVAPAVKSAPAWEGKRMHLITIDDGKLNVTTEGAMEILEFQSAPTFGSCGVIDIAYNLDFPDDSRTGVNGRHSFERAGSPDSRYGRRHSRRPEWRSRGLIWPFP